MSEYDENYTKEVEKEIEKIRAKALKIVQNTHPEINTVIDNRTIYDYSESVWDYPGKWYLYFKLPNGFNNEIELALSIAKDTIDFFTTK